MRLRPLLFNSPTKGTMKTIFFHLPPSLPMDPPVTTMQTAALELHGKQQSILTQEQNTDVTKTLLTIDITRIIGGNISINELYLLSFS